MKYLSILAAAILAGSSAASASMLAYNTEEYRLNGGIDFDSAAGTDLNIELGYGYFIQDYLETGALIAYEDNDYVSTFSGGGFAEYNFETETALIPFIGSSLRLAYAKVEVGDRDNSNTALALGVYAGAKYFVYDNMAISARIIVEGATEDIYVEDDDINDVDVRADFGLRFFF